MMRQVMSSLLILCLGAASRSGAQANAPDTVRVSPNGEIRSVTQALKTVSRGGTVVIMAGVYREPMIAVVRPVSIVGNPGAILDGNNRNQIMSVGADSVSIRGLTFRNVGSSYTEDRAAIKVSGAQHCEIAGNTVENGFFGIYLAKVSDCRIVGNRLTAANVGESSSGNGIHLWSSRDIVISDNSVTGFRDGIYFEFVHASEIARNRSANNLRYGLHFMYSDSCRYSMNEFRHNLAGVAVMYTKSVTMESNVFADNWGSASYGLLLKEISDAQLQSNTFSGNTVGIVADGAVRINARANDFRNNGWAVRLLASTYDGHFTGNNFTGNSFDVASDSEESSNEFSGNYFDSYKGFDRNRDHTGDLPHYPVRLVSMISARYPMTMILMRSMVLDILDMAERVLPSLIPTSIVDRTPAMRPVSRS
jgi:nitrous oxidase accessory protein